MVNLQGRKKERKHDWGYISIFLTEKFAADFWKIFQELAENDNDPAFLQYAQAIEGQDVSKRNQGRRGIYIRWVLARHVSKNRWKLKK